MAAPRTSRSRDHYSAVELEDREAVWAKCIYVFVNVVKAGLVRDYRDWPGVRSEPRDWVLGAQGRYPTRDLLSQKQERWASVEPRCTIPPQLRDRDPEERGKRTPPSTSASVSSGSKHAAQARVISAPIAS